ncbi:MAG: FAD-dependent oxidoreductase [Pseudomonadota bacterium]
MGGQHVAVVGAGIIGSCCALELRRRGFEVTVVDPAPPGSGASKGNAGGIAPGEVLPLASPGILRKAPRWLLDPLGPLAVRPGYLPQLVPWLWRFWRASSAAQVQRSARALAALNGLTFELTEPLFRETGLSGDLRKIPALNLYESETAFQRDHAAWQLRAELGVRLQMLEGAALRELEPTIGPMFTRGVLLEDWALVSDPYHVARQLARAAEERGADFRSRRVVGAAGLALRLEGGESLTADHVVIAAGAWSHRLARNWGDKIPLEAERGYNTTLPAPGISLGRELIFSEHGFVATPLSVGLRIGGAAELAGLEAPPNYARSAAMLTKAKRFLPGLASDGGSQWMGARPSLPDSLPVIGPSPGQRGVVYAFGHGHLGLTQGAATGRLVADIITGQDPPIDLAPFRADRF